MTTLSDVALAEFAVNGSLDRILAEVYTEIARVFGFVSVPSDNVIAALSSYGSALFVPLSAFLERSFHLSGQSYPILSVLLALTEIPGFAESDVLFDLYLTVALPECDPTSSKNIITSLQCDGVGLTLSYVFKVDRAQVLLRFGESADDAMRIMAPMFRGLFVAPHATIDAYLSDVAKSGTCLNAALEYFRERLLDPVYSY